MKTKITIKDLENWGSCYTYEQHKKAFGKRKFLTPMQICNMRSIPVEDRLWVLLREEIIPAKELRLLACDFAEEALIAERKAGREPDERSWKAIAVSRDYANGKATIEDLETAAWTAASAAVVASVYAVSAAAYAAAVVTAAASVYAAAVTKIQLEQTVKTLKALGYE